MHSEGVIHVSELQEYKCPCCGGAVAFDSGIQKMKCPYCDTEFEMETLAALDMSMYKKARIDVIVSTGEIFTVAEFR